MFISQVKILVDRIYIENSRIPIQDSYPMHRRKERNKASQFSLE